MQDLEQLPSDAEGREALVWQGADPLLDGRHHAAVDERLLQILPGDKLLLHSHPLGAGTLPLQTPPPY